MSIKADLKPGPPASSTEPAVASTPKSSRKTLTDCFSEARRKFQELIADPLIRKSPKREESVKEFLSGTNLEQLEKACQELSSKAEDKANNTASKLLTTLEQFKDVGDAFISFAPESVSMVWFGISSLITIGNAKIQTRLLICETCDSIANIVADCIRWEARTALSVDNSQEFGIWESDVPDLVYLILDFLWNARPHLDQSRLKRAGSSLRDLFTRELQQKVDALLEKYQGIVKDAQTHFQESVYHESLKTGQKLEEIENNLKQYVSLGAQLIDVLQKQELLYELDRQQARLSHPKSYKLHFTSLNDRLNKIIRDRNGRPPANWLLKDDAYSNWRSDDDTRETNLFCLRGPRGHGKSVAMMSIHRDITKIDTKEPSVRPLVCHFFFKKGEQDVERARSGLESILYQLLSSNELRRDLSALITTIEILNPKFGEEGAKSTVGDEPGKLSGGFLDSLALLCDAIKTIANSLPVSVYVMIDAIDECIDRREELFVQHLRSLVESKTGQSTSNSSTEPATADLSGLRLVVSARDSIDLVGELLSLQPSRETEPPLPKHISLVDITPEKNSSDLQEYLMYEVGDLLSRRIDRTQYVSYYNSELLRIVKIIHGKASGDFTLARLITANLQQPSKETLEKRIKRLPTAIGDIYMASLESLTSDEQELVITTLKWVVWSVSGMNILELSDHYRDIYKDTNSEIENEDWVEVNDQNLVGAEPKPLYKTPYDDPDIKDIIYHIENAGRDFFKFDRNTRIVNVDISIREWVQQDSLDTKPADDDPKGFNKFRDPKGNTVFQFVLTPSFVRYGDTLSQLFSEKEAHMSIAINILRALNSKTFQEKYMPWKPDWVPGQPKQQRRYEIDHWQDHIGVLQKWWTDRSLDDSWWSELLTELSIFLRPENWHRWNFQREFTEQNTSSRPGPIKGTFQYLCIYRSGGDEGRYWKNEYIVRAFEEPIHLACFYGLPLVIDLLVREDRLGKVSTTEDSDPMRASKLKHIKTIRAKAFIQHFKGQRLTGNASRPSIMSRFARGLDRDEIISLLRENEGGGYVMTNLRRTFEILKPEQWDDSQTSICDKESIYGQLPLHIAAANPETGKQLIKHGADISLQTEVLESSLMPVPILVAVFKNIITLQTKQQDGSKVIPLLLKTAELLILEGADLDVEDEIGATVLHLAARVRNLKFFKFLCLAGDWDVHKKDGRGQTPLHCLFLDPRPTDLDKVQQILDICKIIIKMGRPGELINIEDDSSCNPLAYAVGQGFKDAVEFLVQQGIDIHDEDHYHLNCFHHLCAAGSDKETDIKIADILLSAGLGIAKFDSYGNTPLHTAVKKANWHLASYFLEKYDKSPDALHDVQNIHELLNFKERKSASWFHFACEAELNEDEAGSLAFFQQLNTILSKDMDTNELLFNFDRAGLTALHRAIVYSNLNAVKAVLAINPDIDRLNAALENALDIAANMILRRRDELGDTEEKELKRNLEIFEYIYSRADNPSKHHVFALLTGLDGEKLDGYVPSRLDLLELFKKYDFPYRNDYGWSLFDYISAQKDVNSKTNTYLKQLVPPAPIDFKRPTRISQLHGDKISCEHGISFKIPPTAKSELSFVTDRPVPPTDTIFYFEISLVDVPQSEKGLFEICIRNLPFKAFEIVYDVFSGSISISRPDRISQALDSENEKSPQPPDTLLGEDGISAGKDQSVTSTDRCFGCGVNPKARFVFFTVDGVIGQKLWALDRGIHFPCIQASEYRGGFKLNFGAKEFKFKEANDIDWLRNWSKWRWDDGAEGIDKLCVDIDKVPK